MVEMALSSGVSGPPLHLHPTHAEAFYVLAGQLSLQVGEEVVTGGPGTWACAPKDVPHTLGNFGTDEGRLLCMFAPGGFERRFERMADIGADVQVVSPIANFTTWPGDAADVELLRAILDKLGAANRTQAVTRARELGLLR